MTDLVAAALDNLRAPAVLFFALGLMAALVRSDLSIPESIAKAMSLYLMMAIGFKGGAALAEQGIDTTSALLLVCAGALSFAMPLLAFGCLRSFTKLSRVDAAAISAHYGSISIVTFIAASEFLRSAAPPLQFEAALVAAAAVMETPAILTGLWLAGRGRRAAQPGAPAVGRQFFREVALNGSVVMLLGALAVGAISGSKGSAAVAPFLDTPFKGVLCLFLLDLGLVAGRRLRGSGVASGSLLAFGLYMPLIGAALGLAVARLLGLPPSDGALLAVLGASASYIAVPAALRLALPEANPALSMALALGITFPFNIVFGIPLYYAAAGRILG